MSPDRLVNLVCNRLLNHPVADRDTRIIQPKRDVKPFDMADYDIHQFNPQDRATQKKFYPFFKHPGHRPLHAIRLPPELLSGDETP